MSRTTESAIDAATIARGALEDVCSGRRVGAAADYYSDRFVDHVNGQVRHGLDGVRRSVALYERLFDDLRFDVAQQVVEGDLVATRFVLHGSHRGRRVTQPGIVISRIANRRIVEDYAATDSLNLIRQLGVLRTLWLLITQPSVLRH